MLKYSLLLLAILATNLSFAQALNNLSAAPLTAYGAGVNMRVNEMPPAPPDMDNSLYISEEWLIGDILLENGSVLKKVALRYDIANGYIEIKDDKIVRAVAERNVQQFNMKDSLGVRWYANEIIFKPDAQDPELLEILYDKSIKLLLSARVQIINNGGGFTDQRREASDSPITSRKIEKLYLYQDKQLIEVSSKAKLLKAFAQEGDKVKKYAKENKLSFSKNNDVKKLVAYYDTLVD
jgi:hypothetical protein